MTPTPQRPCGVATTVRWAPPGAVCQTAGMSDSPELRSRVRWSSEQLPPAKAGVRFGPLGRRLLVAAVVAGLGGLAFAIDLPVARWFRTHDLPSDLGRLVDFAEAFAHGLGVAVLLGVAVALDQSLRPVGRAWRTIGRMVIASYAGGLVVNVIKLIVTRVRPRAADLAELTTPFATFGTAALAKPVEVSDAALKSSDLMSFPSGHAAAAAALATVLAWKYPHGLPVFVGLATLAAAQRVVSSAHYPSDVAFGAAVGVAVAAVCLGRSRPVGAGAGAGSVAGPGGP